MSSSAHFELPPLATVSARGAASQSTPVADVRLFHTADGGDIEFIAGQPTMSDGLDTAVYLSLFGGNEQDSGLQGDDRKQWWANIGETDQARIIRSRTQNLLRSIPAITGNLRRIEDAAKADLGWMLADVASAIEVTASMPSLNRVALVIDVTVSNTDYQFVFATRWGVAA